MPPDDTNKKTDSKSELAKGLSLVSQISFTLIACILIGIFGGRFLDSFFGTSPWLLLIFTFFGIIAAFKYIYDLGKRM